MSNRRMPTALLRIEILVAVAALAACLPRFTRAERPQFTTGVPVPADVGAQPPRTPRTQAIAALAATHCQSATTTEDGLTCTGSYSCTEESLTTLADDPRWYRRCDAADAFVSARFIDMKKVQLELDPTRARLAPGRSADSAARDACVRITIAGGREQRFCRRRTADVQTFTQLWRMVAEVADAPFSVVYAKASLRPRPQPIPDRPEPFTVPSRPMPPPFPLPAGLSARCWLEPLPGLGFSDNPCLLRVDLDDDGTPDTAQLVESTRGARGVAVWLSTTRAVAVAGAGVYLGNGDDYRWLDAWRVNGAGLEVHKTEASSGLITWNGHGLQWRQLGD